VTYISPHVPHSTATHTHTHTHTHSCTHLDGHDLGTRLDSCILCPVLLLYYAPVLCSCVMLLYYAPVLWSVLWSVLFRCTRSGEGSCRGGLSSVHPCTASMPPFNGCLQRLKRPQMQTTCICRRLIRLAQPTSLRMVNANSHGRVGYIQSNGERV
jgi:hypothetical protein